MIIGAGCTGWVKRRKRGKGASGAQLAPRGCDKEARLGLGLAKFETNRFDDAIELLTHSARLSPRYPRVYYELGKILEARRMPENAVKMYRKYLKLGPPEEFAEEVRRIIENLGF